MLVLLKKGYIIKLIPFLITILVITISSTIHPPQGYGMTNPFIPLVCIVYWLLLEEEVLGIFHFFIIGVYTDLILGSPLGGYLLLFTILKYISFKLKRKFLINSFLKNIVAALFLIIIFYLINNLFLMIYYTKIVFSEFFVLNIMSTILLYPVIAVIFNWIYKNVEMKKYYAET